MSELVTHFRSAAVELFKGALVASQGSVSRVGGSSTSSFFDKTLFQFEGIVEEEQNVTGGLIRSEIAGYHSDGNTRIINVVEAQRAEPAIETTVNRTRPAILSITHKLSPDHGTPFNISETGQSSPHHHVAGWRIGGTSEIATELCDLG